LRADVAAGRGGLLVRGGLEDGSQLVHGLEYGASTLALSDVVLSMSRSSQSVLHDAVEQRAGQGVETPLGEQELGEP
jgi:hypothetical protein